MNKAQLRAEMRAMRRGLAQEAQWAASQAVFERIAAYEPYRQAQTVMAYAAVRGELSLETVIADVLAGGKALLLPRCEAPGIMTARRIRSMDDLAAGTYGLMEPKESCEISDPKEIDLIFVPGVAFDRRGHRLGQGGGYYDRFLKESGARRVGVCHDLALLESVPFDRHDIGMDDVITPGGIFSAGEFCDRRT